MIKKSILYYMLLSTCLIACYADPEFHVIPRIEHRSTAIGQLEQGQDTINITLYFEDGDGNLGLGPNEGGLFADSIFVQGLEVLNKFRHNYFITTFKKENNILTEVVFPVANFTFNSRFPRLNTLGSETPLSGELSYTIPISYQLDPTFNIGDTLVFRVSIADRSLNTSNEIETPEVVVGVSTTN